MSIKSPFILILFLIMATTNAQNLSSHRWNDRIILLLTDDVSNDTYQKQITEVQKHVSGLNERQLIVYHIQPEQFKKGVSASDWETSSSLFKTYKKTNSIFEFVLIGLDGGVKLQQSEFITCEKLFSFIDVMPMRKRELRKND